MQILTSGQIQDIVEIAREGESQTQRVKTLAAKLGVSEPQMWRYMREGLPQRMNVRVRDELVKIAKKHKIILKSSERPKII